MGCGTSDTSSTDTRVHHKRRRSLAHSPSTMKSDKHNKQPRSPIEVSRFRHSLPHYERPDSSDLEKVPQEALYSSVDNVRIVPPKLPQMQDFRDPNYTFLIKPFQYKQSRPEDKPEVLHKSYRDMWNDNHVRMPCSPHYLMKGQPMWTNIRRALNWLRETCENHSQANFTALQDILAYLAGWAPDLRLLRIVIASQSDFLTTVLPKMCTLALNVETICGQAPPLLRAGVNSAVTMSQEQAASLLACAFFCMFPYRSNAPRGSQYANFPDPNFHRLYGGEHHEKIEKLKCLLHYFRRVTDKMPSGVITFRRVSLGTNDSPNWKHSNSPLCRLFLTKNEKIEDIPNVLQVDFANKFIGGGVLGSGCVQEEIRFSICPEMLVSLLLCERMDDNECVFLIGCARYSNYQGYSESFKFDSPYCDSTPKDSWGRQWSQLVAMDAIFFRNPAQQYEMGSVRRELLKAFVSFDSRVDTDNSGQYPVATGHWGCGAFNGDKQLKSIIQLMAASEARRPLIYCSFSDRRFLNAMYEIYNYLKEQRATVSDMYKYLSKYSQESRDIELFSFIKGISVQSIRSS